MPERYSMKTPSKWFRLFPQIEKARLQFSGSTTTLQFPIETNENNWYSLTGVLISFMMNTFFCSTYTWDCTQLK